ncbi:MAG: hypothetical protein ABIM99_02105 [Candidatus Dojkabacteria bacterium]
MKTRLIIIIIVLNIIFLIGAGLLFVYPGTKYDNYKPTSADQRILAYFIKPNSFTYELVKDPSESYLLITNSNSVVKANLSMYNSQSIDTMFNGWIKYDKQTYHQLIVPPANCTYLRVNIYLNLSEKYLKINDFDPNGQVQNNSVLQSLFCVATTDTLETL